MEVVGWSPSEQSQDSDMFELPPQVESWSGAEDGDHTYVPPSSPIRLSLTHNPLSKAFTLVLPPPLHLPLAPSLPPSTTTAVSKIRNMFLALEMHSSSTAATSL